MGKSTTTLMLAEGLALTGYRVLVVDLDPQAMSSKMLLGESGLEEAIKQGRTLGHLLKQFAAGKPPQISKYVLRASDLAELRDASDGRGVDVIASNPELLKDLADLEHKLRSCYPDVRIDITLTQLLGKALKPVEANYDVVIFDSAAGSMPLSHCAVRLSQDVLAPTNLEDNAYSALRDFLRVIVEEDLGLANLRGVHVLMTMFMASNPLQQQMLDQIRGGILGLNEIPRPVPHSTAIQRAGAHPGRGNFRRAREKYTTALPDVTALANAVVERIIERE